MYVQKATGVVRKCYGNVSKLRSVESNKKSRFVSVSFGVLNFHVSSNLMYLTYWSVMDWRLKHIYRIAKVNFETNYCMRSSKTDPNSLDKLMKIAVSASL